MPADNRNLRRIQFVYKFRVYPHRNTTRPFTMASSAPNARRLRILEERESLQDQIYRQTEEFAAPIPPNPLGSSQCRFKQSLSYGRGTEFDIIGTRWGMVCISTCHSIHSCLNSLSVCEARPCQSRLRKAQNAHSTLGGLAT